MTFTMYSMKKTRLISIFLLLVLAACGSSKSPVTSRSTVDRYAESEKLGGRIVTIVQRGDTWYGIAFANSLNVAELAAWNGLTETDKLRIGQRIRLTQPPGFQMPKGSVSTSESVVGIGSTKVITVKPSSPATRSSRPAQNSSNAGKTAVTRPKVPRTQPSSAQKFDQKTVRWTWPLRGKLLSRFSPSAGRKGIDIAGRQNQEVRVAAPGKVVYQGNGIKGYNNLIIIKHSDDLLSAYAHNQKVFVREGQWVTSNQAISTVGLRNGKPLLHFEIRRNGKPVDPLRYLGKQ